MVKVVLTQDVTSLGKAGELKDVSPGYMRNFLVPKKMAVMATVSELQTLEARRTAIVRAQQKVRTDDETLAARLAEAPITFQVRVGEQKRLYGSITSKDITDELARAYAITLDRRDIDLEEPLKNIGTFSVPVKLGHDVKASISVTLEEATTA